MSYHSSGNGKETKVLEIVTHYRRVKELPPVVSELFKSPDFEGMFWDTLGSEHVVMCHRSQDLADNEITILQKAFSILFRNDCDRASAAYLWVDEILGLKVIEDIKKAQTLDAAIRTRAITLDRMLIVTSYRLT